MRNCLYLRSEFFIKVFSYSLPQCKGAEWVKCLTHFFLMVSYSLQTICLKKSLAQHE